MLPLGLVSFVTGSPRLMGAIGVAGAAAAVGMAIMLGVAKWDAHTLRTAAAEAKLETALVQRDLEVEKANVARLEKGIAEANAAAQKARAEGAEKASAADRRANQVLAAYASRRRAIETDTATGPDALNAWLQATLEARP